MKDYYHILGISSSAHAVDIKRAYRRLAVMYHPDKNPDPDAEQLFKEINEAYDVIGDPTKRFAYDQRRANPWVELVETQEPPAHRDPAYRRNRPQPQGPRVSETYLLMKEYLPFVYWTCWASLIAVCVLFLDYVLPYKIHEETIVEVYAVKSRRSGISHFIAVTETGISIKFYRETSAGLYDGAKIRLARTRVYSTNMWAESVDSSQRSSLAYIYNVMLFVPLTMLGVCIFGIIRKRQIDSCFNASIVSGILLIIFFFLL
jgi:hypothetical protein